MAGNLSDYAENKLLNHILGIEAFAMPEKIYIALFTSDPTDAAIGTEVTGGGYERKNVTGTFSKATTGTSSNNIDHLFPAAKSLWGTITHIAIYDAPTGGNMLWHSKLSTEKTIAATDKIELGAGKITFVMD